MYVGNRFEWLQSLQQEVRAAVCCLRGFGHHLGQPLRCSLFRPEVLYVVVTLLRNGAFLRRIRRGKQSKKQFEISISSLVYISLLP